ncbi:MAG: insulinase family protein [Sphingomonadaceae bacterium]|nr:insulinase family protein [Sphingomonadaceae bacterium]
MQITCSIAKFGRASSLAISIALCIAPLAAQAQPPAQPTEQKTASNAWGHPANDLTPDPAIRYGVLPNGMKYAIRQNQTPKGGASVRLRIGVGSIAEAENELGIAHLLEHMAFNGSTNVPEGEMVKMLERLGLAFGPDTNAVTKFDETIYMLEIPRTDDEMVDAALMLMRETASELTISPAALDRERGVVLSEMQTRNSPQLRQAKQQLSDVMPGTPFGSRFPIGTAAVLANVSADTIRSFYRRYYRPDNATLVLVGDFDPAIIEAKIKARFTSWKPNKAAVIPQNRGKLDTSKPFNIHNFVDPSIPVKADIYMMRPYSAKGDNKATRTEKAIDAVAGAVLSQRLQKIALEKDTRISGGYAVKTDFFYAANASAMSVNGKEGDWKGAVTVAEQELRRALTHGVTDAEVAEALANQENQLKTAAAQASALPSGQIADAIVATLEEKAVADTPEARLALFNTIKPSITRDAVNAALRKAWSEGSSHFHISTKEPIPDLEKTVMATLQESMKVAVTAPAEAVAKAFAYDSFGPAGKVVSDKKIPDLDIRTVRFANGVMLNLKRTDFEPGKIAFGLRVGVGSRGFPADKPGLNLFMSSMAATAALEAHDANELRQALAGHTVANGLYISDSHVGQAGVTTPADIEMQMKLLAAYVSAFGYRPEADTLWANLVPGFTGQLAANPIGLSQVKIPRLMASGDGRFGIPENEELLARNVTELKTYLLPQLKNGAVEISLAGDIDETKAIDIVARTFGALERSGKIPALPADALKIAIPATTAEPIVLTHAGKDDQAVVSVRWATTDDNDMRSDTKRKLLADVMQIRLTDLVREELGATYSPITSAFASDVFPDFGYISVDIVADPSKMETVNAAIGRVAAEMREKPISDDLLLRARKPLVEKFDRESRENKFWQAAIAQAQGDPARLERVRQMRKMLNEITPAELHATAQQYLTDDRRRDFRILSKTIAAQQAG